MVYSRSRRQLVEVHKSEIGLSETTSFEFSMLEGLEDVVDSQKKARMVEALVGRPRRPVRLIRVS